MSVVPALKRLSGIAWSLPPMKMPIALSAMAALPALNTEEGMDVKMLAAIEQFQLPSAIGAPSSLFDSLRLALAGFKLTDLDALALELPLAMTSFENNIKPNFKRLLNSNMMPFLSLGPIAGLFLKIKLDLGIDPIKIDLPTLGDMQKAAANRMQFRLPNKLNMKLNSMKLYIPLMQLALKMNMELGETFSALMKSRMQMLSNLHRPSLQPTWPILVPEMMRLAMALEAIAAIEEAFGPDALDGHSGSSRMVSTIKMWSNFKLPMPPIKADLSPPVLPAPELLEQMTAHPANAFPVFNTAGMKFPVMGPLSACGSLAFAFKKTIGIDPLAIKCGLC